MATRNWQVRRLSAALGAEVTGVTLANADAAEAADIRRLLHEHLVLETDDGWRIKTMTITRLHRLVAPPS